jgi:hypothetical protein
VAWLSVVKNARISHLYTSHVAIVSVLSVTDRSRRVNAQKWHSREGTAKRHRVFIFFSKMLKCPYQHIIFTIPHELNYIAKGYPKLVYGVLFKAAWKTIEKLAKDDDNIGGTPGMSAVLHTFGSDLKHHVHLHTLVPFGGVSKEGKWLWPKRKNKIASYRKIRSEFKKIFIKELEHQLQKEDAEYYTKVKIQIDATKAVSWCVHNTPPTAHTKVIEEYLGRYVCRVGVSMRGVKN